MTRVTWGVVMAFAVAGVLPGQVGAQARGLTVHGYLTQAYAHATDHPVLGIPTDGTTDYRALAVQFHYGMTDFDQLVIQFSHQAFGINPASGFAGDVTLDWGFYQHRFRLGSLRVGRLPLPRGLWNEVRDAGTLLPFFRAPFSFYSETADALDGLAMTAETPPIGGFELEANAYAGSYDFVFSGHAVTGPYIWAARIEDVVGGQIWLYAPIDGIRVGIGAQKYDEETGPDSEPEAAFIWQASVEADRPLGSIRAEYEEIHGSDWSYTAYYVQGGVRLWRGLSINAQAEFADMRFDTPGGAETLDFNRDYALGARYAFRPELQLKIEAHRVEGYGMERFVDVTGPSLETGYLIVSIAASF